MGSIPVRDSATPAMATNPKFVFFTDFDGTITLQDSNDVLTDTLGCGPVRRAAINEDILNGRTPFRDGFREMLDSTAAGHGFDACLAACLAHTQLDPGFATFYRWARANNVPIVVVSSGMEPLVRALLSHLLGEEDARQIPVISNTVVPAETGTGNVNEPGGWRIAFRHEESNFGHDKARAIAPYARLPPGRRPVMFYAGDGVSDLSAARETDLLFAKAGQNLVKYCEAEAVPYTTFNDFSDIMAVVQKVVSGQVSVKDAAKAR